MTDSRISFQAVKGDRAVSKTQRCRHPGQQQGQAAVESLIVCMALVVLWAALAWLGRIQDLALHASHAARYAAFASTREDDQDRLSSLHASLLDGGEHESLAQGGDPLVKTHYERPELRLSRSAPLPFDAQVGGAYPDATRLRSGWHLSDQGLLTAQISVVPLRIDDSRGPSSSLLGLEQLDQAYPRILRHVSIMTSAGHAGSDSDAAKRVAGSDAGWSIPVDASLRLGRRVEAVASSVDDAWNRPPPVFDWLGPWADRLPQYHIRQMP